LTHPILSICRQFFDQAVHTLSHQHPRWTFTLSTLLLIGTGGAYAVAALAPDAADLPQRTVVEQVQAAGIAPDMSFTEPTLNLYRSDTTRSSDSAEALLKRLGIDDMQAAEFLRRDTLARQHLLGRAGRQVTAEAGARHDLRQLVARWAPDDSGQFKRLVIQKSEAGDFRSRLETAALQASARLAGGVIRSSLFAATDDAGLPDAVATQIAEIFSTDIDFRRALRKDDRFNVVYEVLEADGEPMRSGRVLSAEFVNAGKTYQAMWFQAPGRDAQGQTFRGGYYTLDGQSKRRAFLSSPVAFSRVSSGFAMRFHPVLKQWRQHLGTDFAAPTGTPARSVGDGVVTFAGWQNGYGNVVFIKHSNNTDTVYAHLSQLAVRRGDKVDQGQTIGLVGSTGWATGPHLHFEVRVNGQQQDPMVMARQSETLPVPDAARPQFRQLAAQVRSELLAAASMGQTPFQ